jgi:hypothetical protein
VKTKLWIALAFITTFALGFGSGYWIPKPMPLPIKDTPIEEMSITELSEQAPPGPNDAVAPPPGRRTTQAPAEDEPRPGHQQALEREKAQRERLAELLELREEQKPAFDSSTQAFHQQMNRTLQETRIQTRKKILAQNDSLDQRMRKILNPAQYETWKKFHERRQQFLRERQHLMQQKGPLQPRM